MSRPRLTPELLVAGYVRGCFPMARGRRSTLVDWYAPERRGVLPLDGLHVPRRLRRTLASGRFEVTFDRAFREVVEACAAPRRGSPDTWINQEIVDAYTQLHTRGLAHSVEVWRAGRLVGGAYGVALASAFFGESMFHRPEYGGTDASKVAVVALVERLRAQRFLLLDVQMVTPITERLGALEIAKEAYMARLAAALAVPASFGSPTRTRGSAPDPTRS